MVLFTGKTVEEAIETGLQELGLSRLKAHIKVISKEKKVSSGSVKSQPKLISKVSATRRFIRLIKKPLEVFQRILIKKMLPRSILLM